MQPLNNHAFVSIQGFLDVIQHRALIPAGNVLDHVHQFFEHVHDAPIVFRATFDVAALPMFLDQIDDVATFLLAARYQGRFRTGRGGLLRHDEILFIAHD